MSRTVFVIAVCNAAASVFAMALSVCFVTVSFAGLVLQPTGGAPVVYSGGGEDDQRFELLNSGSYATPGVNGSFAGNFYGNSVSNLWISENGNLNFDGVRDSVLTEPFSSLSRLDKRLIAPFWDDFQFVDGEPNQIINHSVPGSYMAITWKNVWLSFDNVTDPLEARTIQVVWFEREMSLPGSNFKFEKDDIAFGYSGFRYGNVDATIGVGHGTDLGMSTGIPGGRDGAISSSNPAEIDLIPWGDDEFLLFRPNGSSYDATIKSFTAVPEPTSMMVAIGWVAFAISKWRRQILKRFSLRKPLATEP